MIIDKELIRKVHQAVKVVMNRYVGNCNVTDSTMLSLKKDAEAAVDLECGLQPGDFQVLVSLTPGAPNNLLIEPADMFSFLLASGIHEDRDKVNKLNEYKHPDGGTFYKDGNIVRLKRETDEGPNNGLPDHYTYDNGYVVGYFEGYNAASDHYCKVAEEAEKEEAEAEEHEAWFADYNTTRYPYSKVAKSEQEEEATEDVVVDNTNFYVGLTAGVLLTVVGVALFTFIARYLL